MDERAAVRAGTYANRIEELETAALRDALLEVRGYYGEDSGRHWDAADLALGGDEG